MSSKLVGTLGKNFERGQNLLGFEQKYSYLHGVLRDELVRGELVSELHWSIFDLPPVVQCPCRPG